MKSPRPPLWIRVSRTTGLALLGSFVVLFLFVVFFENKFIFLPSRYPAGVWSLPPEDQIEDVQFEASDGVKLHGWFAQGERSDRTILFFHGNAGNLSDRADWIRSLRQVADVFIIDYRGYGKSEGSPDEAGIYLDAEAAYRLLTETRGVPADRIVIYGKSLGGAPACELASRFPCAALILQSTFTDAKTMARIMMPLFPAGWFLRTRFDNIGKIAKIEAPKLIVHSRDDEMLPYRMAEKMYEAAAEPKTLKTFEGAGHNDLIWMHRAELIETFREFLYESSGSRH